jgi:hypothetical protein
MASHKAPIVRRNAEEIVEILNSFREFLGIGR